MTPTPRFCYVILAHTDPDGLVRLVRRIRTLSPHGAIVVRHEDPDLISPAELSRVGAIDLVSTIRVRWGSWGMVQAMVEAFGVALRETDADYMVLISGQDYPIRPLAVWERQIVESRVEAVFDPMDATPRSYGRHYVTFELPGRSSIPKRAVHALMDRIGRVTEPRIQLYRLARTGPDRFWFSVPRRGGDAPPHWFFKASQWMTVSRTLMEQILDVAGPDCRGLRRMRTVLVPDEIALQSTACQLTDSILEAPTSVTSFPAHAPSPDWLTATLVEELASTSRAPFARKIPVSGWEEAVLAADQAVAAEEGTAPEPEGVRAGRHTSSFPVRTRAVGGSVGPG